MTSEPQTIAEVEARLGHDARVMADQVNSFELRLFRGGVRYLGDTARDLTALLASHRRMREAAQDAAIWHDAQAKALSKQPPGGDRDWRRMEHREQAESLCQALQGDADADR